MFTLLLLGLSCWIAVSTTRRVTHYGASGMTAGMAAMMAAMGTGLSVGYGAGMAWDLGLATLIGVLAGGAHGLWMGRRFGPMAALDGAGGGVMGGLMGPMLSVMLLYLPVSLLATAWLMLALQAAFSLGAVYLVAAQSGADRASGWFALVGRLLGAHYEQAPDCLEAPPAALPVAPARRSRGASARTVKAHRAAPRQTRIRWTAAGLIGGAAVALIVGGLLSTFAGSSGPTAFLAGGSGAPAGPAVVAAPGPDGVQQLAMTLTYPRYEPRLVEVKAGAPVRLTLQAIGEPGWGAVTLVRGLGQRLVVRANQSGTVEFTPEQPGDYTINCSMNMLVPATLRVS